MMIFWSNWWNEFGRGNRSTQRKPATLATTKSHMTTRSRTPDRSGGKPATNRLSYGAARSSCHFISLWSKYSPQHPVLKHPQSASSRPISSRLIFILSSHLRLDLPSGLFPSCFPTKTIYAFLTYIHLCPVNLGLLDRNNI
jgi:hypothetical protein